MGLLGVENGGFGSSGLRRLGVFRLASVFIQQLHSRVGEYTVYAFSCTFLKSKTSLLLDLWHDIC